VSKKVSVRSLVNPKRSRPIPPSPEPRAYARELPAASETPSRVAHRLCHLGLRQ